jgi:hypothetical protein
VRGTDREFIVLQVRDWVNIVALTPENDVVLVRQFRFGIESLSLEVPGGVIESRRGSGGRGPARVARGDGLRRAELFRHRLRPSQPRDPEHRCHLVLIEDVRRVAETEWDADEEIEVVTLPLAEALVRTRDGGITHALALNALHLAAALRNGPGAPGLPA